MIFVVFRAHTLLLCVYFRVNMLFDLTIAVFNELTYLQVNSRDDIHGG